MGLRIIAGSLRGRRLYAPTWDGLRPTSDKLRETLFNVLAPRITGARVFDGYAGTGAVGIEALSRGAAWATFVDDDRRAEALIARNLAHCGVTEGYAIIRASVEHAFDSVSSSRESGAFDIVFLDPPYGRAGLDEALAAGARLMAADTLLIIEHARRDEAPASHGGLQRTRTLPSGDSALTFYRLAAGAPDA
jgi:16S rRNA (guanine966-N2)-methyltransferase